MSLRDILCSRLRKYGAPLRDIETIRSHKVDYYSEDEITLLLNTIDEFANRLKPLEQQVKQFEARSTEYLEIYKQQEAELTELRRKV